MLSRIKAALRVLRGTHKTIPASAAGWFYTNPTTATNSTVVWNYKTLSDR